MSAQSFEMTLARLYTDPKFRQRFLKEPDEALLHCNLTPFERNEFLAIDKAGLIMASHSFLNKRKKRSEKRSRQNALINFVRKIGNALRG